MKKTVEERTFVIRVLDTQNSTWQGTVSWTASGRQEHFRSALELIRLMDSTMAQGEHGSEAEENG